MLTAKTYACTYYDYDDTETDGPERRKESQLL